MSTDIPTMRAPVTRADWPDDPTPAAFTIAGNAAKPTAITDPNVYPIPLVMRAVNEGKADSGLPEVEELWQFLLETDNADSDCLVTVWAYNQWTGAWHRWAKLEVKGDNLADSSHGMIWTDNGVCGTSHIGIQVENHAGNELYVTHMWR